MSGKDRSGFRAFYLLLAVPFIAMLWVPFYNYAFPAIAGIPYYYWYQLVWVPLTAAILGLVYRLEGRK